MYQERILHFLYFLFLARVTHPKVNISNPAAITGWSGIQDDSDSDLALPVWLCKPHHEGKILSCFPEMLAPYSVSNHSIKLAAP